MRKILILSGKGGTGKTTIASNFINISKSRVFADTDVEAPNLHLVAMLSKMYEKEDYYGLDKYEIDQDVCISCGLCKDNCRFDAITYNEGQYLIEKNICEGCGVCEFVCPVKAISPVEHIGGEIRLYNSLKVFSTAELKMGSGNSGLLVTKVKKKIEPLIKEDDLVIIDGPPGIGCPVIASMSGVDLILLVAEPSVSGVSDLKRIIKTAASFHLKMAVCINKYDLNKEFSNKIIAYLKENNLHYVGKISYNNEVSKFINEGKTLPENSRTYKEIKAVYDNTMNLV